MLIPVVAVPLLLAPAPARAHEIPRDVTVRAFVKPEGRTLVFLVRVPLEAMRDFEFPRHGPGYLDVRAAAPMLRDAASLWVGDYVRFYEDGTPLAAPRLVSVRASLPSDPSFARFDAAFEHLVSEPRAAPADLVWQQAMLDAMFEYPIGSDQSRFSVRPALAHLGQRTLTVLWFLPPGRSERVYQYTGDPGLVRLDPRWHQAAARFVTLGFSHILDGLDHLLFLLCLVIPAKSLLGLVAIISSFTVAHSITLIASASGLAPSALWFPPLIETLIALSIVYMAIENVVGPRHRRRWLIAFGFGLVHGFGFSFVLRESLQFAGSHLLTSLLAFNIGVELGQLAVLAVTVPLLGLLFRRVVAERMGTIILSVLVGHSAWHWMTDRGSALLRYRFTWPSLDLELVAGLLRWLMLAVIVGGAAWAQGLVFGKLLTRHSALGTRPLPKP
jgi:hypothetical protein